MSQKANKRREKVMELYAKGYNQSEVARRLGVSQSQISRDIQKIRKLATQNRVRVNVKIQ